MKTAHYPKNGSWTRLPVPPAKPAHPAGEKPTLKFGNGARLLQRIFFFLLLSDIFKNYRQTP